MICEKINNSNNYECKVCYGTEIDLLFKSGPKYEEIYSKSVITNFFGELGAVKYDDLIITKKSITSDITKWVVMNNDIDKIYTFGENDDEFHIIRRGYK
jgi:hypothetical protein